MRWWQQYIIHSFIHCRHLYSASSSGATQKLFIKSWPICV